MTVMRIAIALIPLIAIQAVPAETGPVQSATELLAGESADGQIGDLRLEGERTAFIFSALDHPLNRQPVGGALIDAALSDVGHDRLGEMRTAYGPGTGRLAVNREMRLSADGQAVMVEGVDSDDERITIKTEYRLDEAHDGLAITTWITNGTEVSLEGWEIGDRVRWGSSRIFLMDRGPLFHQLVQTSTRATILFGDQWSAGITIGENQPMTVRRHREEMVLGHSRDDILPGETIETTRHLVVGEESMATIAGALWDLNGVAHGTLRGRITEQGSDLPIGNAELLVNLRGERPTPLLRVLTDDAGEFAVEVPSGVRIIGFPRAFSRTQPTQTVYPAVLEAGGEAFQQYLLNPPARIDLRVTEGESDELLPVRVALYDMTGAPTDLGPVNGGRAAGPYLFVPEGQGVFEVPVGQYRMTVSHGPEHDQWSQDVIFFSGRTREFHLSLDRLIETPNEIAADFGILTNQSPEGMVSPLDRVIAAACAGLDFIVATDTQNVTDLQAAIDDAGLGLPITVDMGERIPPNPEGTLGVHSVFPVPPQYAGASLVQGEDFLEPAALIRTLRERLPNALIATLAPARSGQSEFLAHGYTYDRQTRDFTAPTPIDAGALDLDLFEVMGDFNFDHIRQDLDLAYSLMRDGHQFAFIGSTNSRYNALEEIGNIRTMVTLPAGSPASSPADIDPADVYHALRERHTTVTSGPTVRLSILGHQPGDLLTWEMGEPVDVEISLQAPQQFHLSYLDINKRGTFVQRHTFLRPAEGRVRQWSPEGGSTRLMIRQDDFINIEVAGGRPIQPLHPANDLGPGFVPFAVTTPIWIDADGNGRYDHTVDPDFE